MHQLVRTGSRPALALEPDAGPPGRVGDPVGVSVPGSTVLRAATVLRLCTLDPRITDEDADRTIARIAEPA